jgi:type I restriction enzyme R subunit
MPGLDKKSLSERDICTKFITPAVKQAGWDVLSQIREEVYFTKGRINGPERPDRRTTS